MSNKDSTFTAEQQRAMNALKNPWNKEPYHGKPVWVFHLPSMTMSKIPYIMNSRIAVYTAGMQRPHKQCVYQLAPRPDPPPKPMEWPEKPRLVKCRNGDELFWAAVDSDGNVEVLDELEDPSVNLIFHGWEFMEDEA